MSGRTACDLPVEQNTKSVKANNIEKGKDTCRERNANGMKEPATMSWAGETEHFSKTFLKLYSANIDSALFQSIIISVEVVCLHPKRVLLCM